MQFALLSAATADAAEGTAVAAERSANCIANECLVHGNLSKIFCEGLAGQAAIGKPTSFWSSAWLKPSTASISFSPCGVHSSVARSEYTRLTQAMPVSG